MGDDYDNEPYFAETPRDLKQLRACKRCCLIKSHDQFYDTGCDNCPFMKLAENKDRTNACTSAFFEGFVSMINPSSSWVARWQRIDGLLPGCYALQVTKDLPEEVESMLSNQNIDLYLRPFMENERGEG